jgi:hypothetical protein
MLVLGFSKTFLQAIAGRALSGFLSGNIGVIKSFLTEITDDSNRGRGFSFMQLGWSLGTICGPLAGGLLCYPAEKYPLLFSPSGVFGEYPFLLPCLLCALVNLFTAVYCFFFMTESRRKIQIKTHSPTSVRSFDTAVGDEAEEEESVSLWNNEMDNSAHSSALSEQAPRAGGILKGYLPNFAFSSSKGYAKLTTSEGESGPQEPSDEIEMVSVQVTDQPSQMTSDDSIHFLPLAEDEETAERPLSPSSGSAIEDDRILNPQAVTAIFCYGLCCMAFIVMDESLPLMLKLDSQEGGLSFTSSQIGSLLSSGGIMMLLWSVTVLPIVANRSKLQLYKVCTLVGIPVALSYPVLASFRNEIMSVFGERIGHRVIFGSLFVSISLRNCLSTSIFMTVRPTPFALSPLSLFLSLCLSLPLSLCPTLSVSL